MKVLTPKMEVKKLRNNEKFEKSIRVRIPSNVQPSDVLNMVEKVSKVGKNRAKSVHLETKENCIEIYAKIGKRKMGKNSKYQKELEYDLSEYYENY